MYSTACGIASLPPAAELGDNGAEESALDEPFPLRRLQAPAMTGTALKAFLAVAESPFFGPLRRQLLRNNSVPQVLEEIFIPERPTFYPNTTGWAAERAGGLAALGAGQAPAERAAAAAALLPGFRQDAAAAADAAGGGARRHHGAADFHRAYRSGALTPCDVAENVIAAVAASEATSPPMRFLISHDPQHLRQQAAASSARWAAGKPLSPLDGVPFAVKDSADALPYPTTAGNGFMAEWRQPVTNLPGVQALLDAGCLLVGKANLHEIGLGTTGLNLLTGTPRNPHSTAHHTGASSSGSAALVAAGLCPFAIGTDGGGSIRIPAAACGIVGLKPTHERVGTAVGTPAIDQTVAVVGPLAARVEDCALLYAMLAGTGQHPGDAPPPPAALPGDLGGGAAGGQPLAGMRAGVYWAWFEDAEPAVVEACRRGVAALQAAGAQVVPLRLPELALLRAAHTCTISSEMRNNMQAALADPAARRRMNVETRVSLAVAGGFSSAAYIQARLLAGAACRAGRLPRHKASTRSRCRCCVQAQKIRTRMETHFRRAFECCDVIVTPTLPCTAPPVKPAALRCGETDLTTTAALMQYMLAPNFLGLPAVSVPVGAAPSTHSPGGGGAVLPVGLQLMAPCWHEATLLHAAAVLEAAVAEAGHALPLPGVWFDALAPRPSVGGR